MFEARSRITVDTKEYIYTSIVKRKEITGDLRSVIKNILTNNTGYIVINDRYISGSTIVSIKVEKLRFYFF